LKKLALEFIYKTKMIATKFKFCKFRHALSPNQKLQSKQISMPLKKQTATLKCFWIKMIAEQISQSV